MMSDSDFTQQDINKYTNYLITSQRHLSPPYEWSDGVFQRYQPVSGNFPIGNNFFGGETCNNNNPTGRAISANSCGYWETTNEQFNPGRIEHHIQMNGTLFPTGNTNNYSVMTNPQNKVVQPYARIGEEYRNR